MKKYEWKNQNGEVVEHDHWSKPPRLPGTWKRVYSFAAGRVEGGGGSPSRTSIKSDEGPTNQVVKLDESNIRWVADAV